MFSKNSDKPYVKLASDERRSAVRITPDSHLRALFQGNELQVFDLSATGVAIAKIAVEVGQVISLQMKLPDKELTLQATVVKHDQRSTHCRFSNISDEMEDDLYHYILDVQKSQIRGQQNH